jgi:MarR family transcriptional regulator, 2-MHQ and catechol-resistance regulon repressor
MKHCLSIYHRFQEIFILLDDGDRRALRELNLTPTQYNLLIHLGTKIEEGLTISDLAQRLFCTRGNATRLVQRLSQQGLALVGGDENDQRLVRVALTPEGEKLVAAARQAHNDSVLRRLGGMPREDQEQLIQLTQIISNMLNQDLAKAYT